MKHYQILADVADVIMGQSPPGSTYNQSGEGLPFFQGAADFGYRFPNPRVYCTEPKRIAEPGDILLSIRAPIGRVNVANRTCAIGRGIAIIRPQNPEDTRYIEFVLRLLEPFWHTVEGSGSVFGNATKADLNQLPLPWPPSAERRAIARILGTLDDKIELNRRVNETLEAMAQALFKSWFVDFDPVVVNALKAGNSVPEKFVERAAHYRENPGALGLSEETLRLFPDRFVDSELGPIPAGWRVGTLDQVAKNPRRTKRPEDIESSTPYIALEHMPKHHLALFEWSTAEGIESSKFQFKRGEILFGKLRPYFHKVGVAPIDGVCSTDILVIAPRIHSWFGFMLGHVSSTKFVEYANACSTGTRMPRTNWADMSRYPLVLPANSVAAAFNELISPLVQHIIGSIHESRTLAFLRNALLPKLIRGEIRMKGQIDNREVM